jgi:RNA polymerase sigma factor (sigma-70 family)
MRAQLASLSSVATAICDVATEPTGGRERTTVMRRPPRDSAQQQLPAGLDDADLLKLAAAGELDLTDATVLQIAARGNADALSMLYQRHGTACYRLARQVTASSDLAEDAVQEAFLGMWRSPASYLPDRGSVRSWLLGMTHHKAVDSVRRESSQQRRQSAQAAQHALDPPPSTSSQDPATIALDGLRAAEVRAALGELPDAQRQALALAYFGGYTQSQIAELTGVPLGTIKTRTFVALRRLRLRLAPLVSATEEGSR